MKNYEVKIIFFIEMNVNGNSGEDVLMKVINLVDRSNKKNLIKTFFGRESFYEYSFILLKNNK